MKVRITNHYLPQFSNLQAAPKLSAGEPRAVVLKKAWCPENRLNEGHCLNAVDKQFGVPEVMESTIKITLTDVEELDCTA